MLLSTLLFAVTLTFPNSSAPTAHEWGTFTMVIDSDGSPIDWYRPHLTEPLPAFVHRTRFLKQRVDFSVRMETPVIYFHTEVPLVVDVTVGFPSGLVTEHFPFGVFEPGSGDDLGVTAWRNLRVDPQFDPAFARELGGDHYYAARAVNSAPVELDRGDHGVERERFIFYRGVANFRIPLRVTQDGGNLAIANLGAETYAHSFVFERNGPTASLVPLGALRPGAVVIHDRAATKPTQRIDLRGIEDALVADGLFRDEAAAMIETWRSSWFEDGLRVLFTVPRSDVDALLPLSITPAMQIERVFVGRYEIVTPERRHEIVEFGNELERGEVSPGRKAEVATRFGRVGYGVLTREAKAFEVSDPARYWKKRELAASFVSWSEEQREQAIGPGGEGSVD